MELESSWHLDLADLKLRIDQLDQLAAEIRWAICDQISAPVSPPTSAWSN